MLVCQGRAVAHGRIALDRFEDPIAMALLREPEQAAVERARADAPPAGWADRIEYEMLAANAEVIVPRTVAIDHAVLARANPQLVILGAGLDSRAWRLVELADVDVFEVDRPASQQDKRDRAEGLRPVTKSVRFVPVDFARDRLGPALVAAGHRDSLPTTWIWEGVVPYLTRSDVEATVGAIAERSATGSRLVVNYQAPSVPAWLGRQVARGLTALSRRPDPAAGERRRSAWSPAAMRRLLTRHGFQVDSDRDLLTLAQQLEVPTRHRHSLRTGRIAVADRLAP